MKPLAIAALGYALAIAITTSMDANGLTLSSALPLLLLTLGFWAWQRLSLKEMGFQWGRLRDYGLALFYPLVVIGATTLVASLAGATHPHIDWQHFLTEVALGGGIGIIGVLLTEEGFFRGWLWGALQRAGITRTNVLILTSIGFALWHLSYVTLAHGFILPPLQIVVFIANAAVMGYVWGKLRDISGSAIVSSLSHSVWNAIAYALFGEGPKIGALGITATLAYGVEVGVAGLTINLVFAAALTWWKRYRVDRL